MRITHIGGPTTLIEMDGWTILTDPTFDDPGRRYDFALGTQSVKTVGPAVDVRDLPAVDVVLLSHDQHADNLDDSGRELLTSVPLVLTTGSGGRRLGLPQARGLAPWQETTLRAPGKDELRVVATPSRHGPPLSRIVVGDSVGFAIHRPGETRAAVWMSGDSVLYRGLREVARRVQVDVALVHIGAVRFGLTGIVKYTMDARHAAVLIDLLKPRVAIPVHYEGWSHFSEGRQPARSEFARCSDDVANRIRWLPIGQTVQFPTHTPHSKG